MDQATLANKLTKKQLYLLRNLILFPDLPLRAKDIFTFLQIPSEYQIEYFDALHDLVPEFLVYSNNYYILPSSKAEEIKPALEPKSQPTLALIEFFKQKFATPQESNINYLKNLEPFVESILKHCNLPSPQLNDLYYNYANYFYLKDNFDKAIEYANQGIEITRQIDANSPILAKYYNFLGYVYWQKNNKEKTREFYQKTLVLLRGRDHLFPKLKFEAILVLADLQLKEKQYNTAIHLYLKALDLMDKILFDEKDYFHTYIFLHLAKCHKELYNYHKAYYYISKAEHYSRIAQIEELSKIISYEKRSIHTLLVATKIILKIRIYILLTIAAGIILGLFFIAKKLIFK